MYKRKRAGNTITRKINSTKDTAAKADKNHYISNSYLEGFIPIDTEYFTASFTIVLTDVQVIEFPSPSGVSHFLTPWAIIGSLILFPSPSGVSHFLIVNRL